MTTRTCVTPLMHRFKDTVFINKSCFAWRGFLKFRVYPRSFYLLFLLSFYFFLWKECKLHLISYPQVQFMISFTVLLPCNSVMERKKKKIIFSSSLNHKGSGLCKVCALSKTTCTFRAVQSQKQCR